MLSRSVFVPPLLSIRDFNREALVRLRFGDGTVLAVPVFGSGGSSAKCFFLCFSTV